MLEKHNKAEEKRYYDELSKYKRTCKCGHIAVVVKDKKICTWCGNYIYKSKKDEFKDRLRGVLNG